MTPDTTSQLLSIVDALKAAYPDMASGPASQNDTRSLPQISPEVKSNQLTRPENPVLLAMLEQPESAKLCIDCRHMRDTETYYACGNTLNPAVRQNPVYGNWSFAKCAAMRETYGWCGPEGRHFEPKPPRVSKWQRLKRMVDWKV